jgi:hypothetical protein
MRKIVLASIGFMLLNFTIATWTEYKNLEGRFRVLIPTNQMTETLKKVKTDVGELTFHQHIYKPEEKKDDNVFYLVNYCDYPKGSFPKDSVETIQAFLNETVESSAQAVYGKVAYVNDIELQKHKGKIWRVQYNNNNAQIKNKCFLVGDRFYLLQVMTLKEKSLNASVDKFLESFYVF